MLISWNSIQGFVPCRAGFGIPGFGVARIGSFQTLQIRLALRQEQATAPRITALGGFCTNLQMRQPISVQNRRTKRTICTNLGARNRARRHASSSASQ